MAIGLSGPLSICALSLVLFAVAALIRKMQQRRPRGATELLPRRGSTASNDKWCRGGNDEDGAASVCPDRDASAAALRWRGRCIRSMLFLLNLQFFAFVTAALTPLSCETMDESRMSNAPYMKCSDGLRAVGSIALIVYGIAGPLVLGWIVRRNMHSAIFAQFHSAFVPSAKYWELNSSDSSTDPVSDGDADERVSEHVPRHNSVRHSCSERDFASMEYAVCGSGGERA